MDDGSEGHQRIRDGLVHLRSVAVIQQGRVRIIFALRDAGHQVRRGFRPREVVGQSRRDGVVGPLDRIVPAELGGHPGLAGLREQQGVGLSGAVAVHGEGQSPVVVRELDAQGSDGVQVPHLISSGQQVEGDLALPSGGVDEVGGSAERGDFREQAVDGGLERDLQGGQVPARGVGPGILQRQDGGVGGVQPRVLEGLACIVGALGDVPQQCRGDVPARLVARGLQGCNQRLSRVEPPVSQCQRGVEGGLLNEGQQRGGDELTHVSGRGSEGHRGVEVAGARHGEQSGGDPLIHVGCCLPGSHVEGQLVHDAFERIGCRNSRQCAVVGAGDAAVHRSRGGMVGQLQVHGSRRALAVDLDLQSIQGRLVRLAGEALGEAGVHGHQAGSVGEDGALEGGEVRRQSVGCQVRRCGQGGHLALQRRDGCSVDSDGRGVGRVFRLRGISGEDCGELPGGDALQLDDRRLRDAVVQDPPGQSGGKQTHLL